MEMVLDIGVGLFEVPEARAAGEAFIEATRRMITADTPAHYRMTVGEFSVAFIAAEGDAGIHYSNITVIHDGSFRVFRITPVLDFETWTTTFRVN